MTDAREKDPYRTAPATRRVPADQLKALVARRVGIPYGRRAVLLDIWGKTKKEIGKEARGLLVGIIAGIFMPELVRLPGDAGYAQLLALLMKTCKWFVALTAFMVVAAALARMIGFALRLRRPTLTLFLHYKHFRITTKGPLMSESGILAKRIDELRRTSSAAVAEDLAKLETIRTDLEWVWRYHEQRETVLEELLKRYDAADAADRSGLLVEIDQVCGELELYGLAIKAFVQRLEGFAKLDLDRSAFAAHLAIAARGLPRVPRLGAEAEAPSEVLAEGDDDEREIGAVVMEKKR